MAETEIKTGLYENTVGLAERFAEVAATDPIAATMVLSGLVFVALSAGTFGALVAGAVLSELRRLLPNPRAPPRQAR